MLTQDELAHQHALIARAELSGARPPRLVRVDDRREVLVDAPPFARSLGLVDAWPILAPDLAPWSQPVHRVSLSWVCPETGKDLELSVDVSDIPAWLSADTEAAYVPAGASLRSCADGRLIAWKRPDGGWQVEPLGRTMQPLPPRFDPPEHEQPRGRWVVECVDGEVPGRCAAGHDQMSTFAGGVAEAPCARCRAAVSPRILGEGTWWQADQARQHLEVVSAQDHAARYVEALAEGVALPRERRVAMRCADASDEAHERVHRPPRLSEAPARAVWDSIGRSLGWPKLEAWRA